MVTEALVPACLPGFAGSAHLPICLCDFFQFLQNLPGSTSTTHLLKRSSQLSWFVTHWPVQERQTIPGTTTKKKCLERHRRSS